MLRGAQRTPWRDDTVSVCWDEDVGCPSGMMVPQRGMIRGVCGHDRRQTLPLREVKQKEGKTGLWK